MDASKHDFCSMLEAFFDGELETGACDQFKNHLDICEQCASNLAQLQGLRNSIRSSVREDISQESDLRIRRSIHAAMTTEAVDQDIFDIEDAAKYLKLTVRDIIELLPHLPSFEVNGKIRFRKSSILDWAREREMQMQWDKESSQNNLEGRLLKFSGGA